LPISNFCDSNYAAPFRVLPNLMSTAIRRNPPCFPLFEAREIRVIGSGSIKMNSPKFMGSIVGRVVARMRRPRTHGISEKGNRAACEREPTTPSAPTCPSCSLPDPKSPYLPNEAGLLALRLRPFASGAWRRPCRGIWRQRGPGCASTAGNAARTLPAILDHQGSTCSRRTVFPDKGSGLKSWK